jgi:hypothetical protein
MSPFSFSTDVISHLFGQSEQLKLRVMKFTSLTSNP